MKKIVVLLLALCIAFALAGCNVAPNTPIVTPYVTNGTGTYNTNNPYGYKAYDTNKNGTYTTPYGTVKPTNSPLVRSGVNPADKYVVPGVGITKP